MNWFEWIFFGLLVVLWLTKPFVEQRTKGIIAVIGAAISLMMGIMEPVGRFAWVFLVIVLATDGLEKLGVAPWKRN